MIREPYNLNPYNSTIDTSKVNNFSFTFSGDELGSWNIEIAKNNTSPEIVYTSEEFVPEDVGYTHIYDDDIVEGITLPSTIAHSQGDDGLLRRLYSINGYPFNAAVVKLNVNGIENIGNIKGSTANGYLVATNYSLGRAGSNVTIVGFDENGTAIGSQVTDGTYDFLGYLLSVKENSNIEIGQVVQIEGNSFVIGNIEDAGDGYSELTIVNGEATISDATSTLTFDSLAEADVTELTVGIEPVQDLNGQSEPYPAGGGKNLFYIKEQTLDGITVSLNADGSYKLNGSASSSSAFLRSNVYTLKTGTYHLSASSSSSSNFLVRVRNADTSKLIVSITADGGNGVGVAVDTDTSVWFEITVLANSTLSNVNVYPQLEKGTTKTSFAPYSNICPISGHTDAVVTRTGKNLVKPIGTSGSINGINYTENEDGSVTLANTSTAVSIYKHGQAYLKAGVTYALSGGVTNVQLSIRNQSGSVSYAYTESNTTYTPTTDLEAYIFVRVASGKTVNATVYPQLELGSTATAYEPYQGSTYTTSLGQTVYGGTLDMVSGVLTVTHAIVDLSSLSWVYDGSVPRFYSYSIQNTVKAPSLNSEIADIICTQYISTSLEGDVSLYGGLNGSVAVSTGKVISVRDEAYTSVSTFKDAMEGVMLCYALATPVEYQLTPQQIKTLVGTNNVWASSGQIVNIKFEYNIN